MSFAGFKKQISKANQLFNEKLAGAKGTELESDFVEMERKIDVTGKMIEELITKTQDYLQPNPMARARISAVKGLNNLQNKRRNMAYPQPEGLLGDAMIKHGKDLGHNSSLVYSPSVRKEKLLLNAATHTSRWRRSSTTWRTGVKQNFLDPFNSLLHQDLKEINHHRKKLQGRRLDYDCKKRKGSGRAPAEDDVHAAEQKFAESKSLTEGAMINFLSSDSEQVSALFELVSAELAYHQEAARILSEAQQRLEEKRSEAASKPRSERPAASITGRTSSRASDTWKTVGDEDTEGGAVGGGGPAISVKPRHQSTKAATPTCRALFAFTADNNTELAFDEGDVIQLVSRVDDNWYEGELKGNRGFFPVNYVDVIVPLPEE
uniref:SH3 domain-containing GRB2-like protein n=1 Tax=Macrostomum lignano TaxID=282301 RepID=A0A1I8HZ42_9PLAT